MAVATTSLIVGSSSTISMRLAAEVVSLPVHPYLTDDDLDVSRIYVKPGAEAVAESISRLMGGLEVLPMPTPAWITGGTANLGDANVLVMLGHDLADKRLADMA